MRTLPLLGSINKNKMHKEAGPEGEVSFPIIHSSVALQSATMSLTEVVFNTSPLLPKILIPVSAVLAIVFSLILTQRTAKVQVKKTSSGSVRTENGREYLLQVRRSTRLITTKQLHQATLQEYFAQ